MCLRDALYFSVASVRVLQKWCVIATVILIFLINGEKERFLLCHYFFFTKIRCRKSSFRSFLIDQELLEDQEIYRREIRLLLLLCKI